MKELETKLGYTFIDKSLLQTALNHSSYANENRDEKLQSNERLEFLGDSVLGIIVASHLYKNHPNMPEGQMTRQRAELVCEGGLLGVAKMLCLGEHIRLGKGEEHSGGRQRESILADTVEALIAAMYLDGGMIVARKFIDTYILFSDVSGVEHQNSDFKTTLQEIVQKKAGQILVYELISATGPDHSKVFTVRVLINDREIGKGTGRTKKEAEQNAAKDGIEEVTK